MDLVRLEASLYTGIYDIRESLLDIIEFLKFRNSVEQYARAKFLYGWYLVSQGQLLEAKEVLLEAYVNYKRYDNYLGQARALNHLSFIAHQTGDLATSIKDLQACLQLYTKLQDSRSRAIIGMNLAQLYRSSGQLDRSIMEYNAIDLKLLSGDYRHLCVYHLMLSAPYALKHNLRRAKEELDNAAVYIDGLHREKAIYFEFLGRTNNFEADFSKALTALRQGLDISLNIAPESALVSQIKRLMAEAYVGLGDYGAARKFTDEALAVAEKLNERVEVAACHRIYAQLEAFAANTGAAKEWFDKAIKLFAMIGSNYELAVTRYLAAASGAYLNGERHALLYLAREYFESEKIEHYIAKINRELTETPLTPSRPAHSNSEVPTIICRDVSMVRMVELAEHIAPSNMSVLLTGPTGCGKDLFARYIHHHSGRTGRFVSVNAAAIPDNMVESELFGYHKGAYTGAAMTTAGWIEEANGGTFYLNEIADSSPELQAKLLDVIENRRICRLGERLEREIDCRIIAATNHDLEKLIADGRFRLDLYHRLNEIPMHLPGLTGRGGDIELLLEHFLKTAEVSIKTKADHSAFARLSSAFASRPWPGNVRELEIKVRRLALLARGDIARMAEMAAGELPSKKEETQAALDRTGWNRRQVARMLGISESAVRNRIKIYNLAPANQD